MSSNSVPLRPSRIQIVARKYGRGASGSCNADPLPLRLSVKRRSVKLEGGTLAATLATPQKHRALAFARWDHGLEHGASSACWAWWPLLDLRCVNASV